MKKKTHKYERRKEKRNVSDATRKKEIRRNQ